MPSLHIPALPCNPALQERVSGQAGGPAGSHAPLGRAGSRTSVAPARSRAAISASVPWVSLRAISAGWSGTRARSVILPRAGRYGPRLVRAVQDRRDDDAVERGVEGGGVPVQDRVPGADPGTVLVRQARDRLQQPHRPVRAPVAHRGLHGPVRRQADHQLGVGAGGRAVRDGHRQVAHTRGEQREEWPRSLASTTWSSPPHREPEQR